MTSIDEKKKNSHWKIIMTLIQTKCPNPTLFALKNKGCFLPRLELWPQCLKNQLQNSNSNKNYFDGIVHHHHHHHHHVVPLARISLTLSRHFSLSFIASGRSSGLHPVSSHSCCMYVRAGRPAFTWPYVGSIGVHHWWVRPCFSRRVLRAWFV